MPPRAKTSRARVLQKCYELDKYARDGEKIRKHHQEYRKNNVDYLRQKDREKRERNKKNGVTSARHRKAMYGLSPQEFDRLYKECGGLCTICRELNDRRLLLEVDHDHESGVIRGLLCGPCNRAIGLFHDRPELLISALNYLLKYKKLGTI